MDTTLDSVTDDEFNAILADLVGLIESINEAELQQQAREARGLGKLPPISTMNEGEWIFARGCDIESPEEVWRARAEWRSRSLGLMPETSELNDPDPVDCPSGPPAIAEVVMPAPVSVSASASVLVPLLPALPAAALGFPVSTVESMPIADDPLRDLAALCHQVVTPEDYITARSEYCRLSVQLNMMGRLAPAFRPQVNIKAKSGHPVHTRALCDRLVIDYHWCHATNMNFIPSDALHRKVFAPGFAFSFETAWELSGKNWKGVYRGYEALALTDLQQCQTTRLHGPELVEREKKFSGTYRDSKGQFSSPYASARRKIGEWAEKHSRMKAEQRDYVFLWRARELLGAGRAALIPDLLALMLGEAVKDRKTIRGKLALLDRMLNP